MHGCEWMEVDVISERSGLKSEGHTLEYHFLVEIGCVEGGLAEVVYESLQRLVFFLSDAKEGEICGLIWAAASEMSSKHVGKGVKTVNEVWQESSGTSFAEHDIMGCIEGDMSYVYFEVLVRVGFSRITV